MAWATTSEVEDITGSTVSSGELARAESVITVYCGRTPDAVTRLSDRDRYWLRLATAFQAAWQSEQVGYETRSSVDSMSQDGFGAEFSHEWQVVLAPNAARALKNLSWKRSRRAGGARTLGYHSFVMETSDPYHGWYA